MRPASAGRSPLERPVSACRPVGATLRRWPDRRPGSCAANRNGHGTRRLAPSIGEGRERQHGHCDRETAKEQDRDSGEHGPFLSVACCAETPRFRLQGRNSERDRVSAVPLLLGQCLVFSPNAGAASTWTLICFVFVSAFFGSVIRSTPSRDSARTFSVSTVDGTVKVRLNGP